MEQAHEIVKLIKQDSFAFRNGIIADTLRNSGDNHKLILGVNLPQFMEIASKYEHRADVAAELWENRTSRECRILAPMFYPHEEFAMDTAVEWIADVENAEIADNLCHKLLKYQPYAMELVEKYSNSGNDMERYTALRLALNLITIGKCTDIAKVKAIAQSELEKSEANTNIARQVIADCDEEL